MFTHDMEENRKSKVDIVDLDGDTVHDMVRYIYSGKVAELEGKATGLL
jgi:speckle-type POZ protein